MYTQKNINNFWKKVNKTDKCWEWTGGKHTQGYGQLKIKNITNKAHRVSFEMYHNRRINEGMCICHICDNPSCVKPDHLFEGTHTDNMIDRNNKGRANIPTGEKHHKCKLTEKQVLEIRDEYAKGETTLKKLGDEHGVDFSTISLIIRRENWKHI